MKKYKINKKKILSNIEMILDEYEEYIKHHQYTDDEIEIIFNDTLKQGVSLMCSDAELIYTAIHTRINITKMKNKLFKELKELRKNNRINTE